MASPVILPLSITTIKEHQQQKRPHDDSAEPPNDGYQSLQSTAQEDPQQQNNASVMTPGSPNNKKHLRGESAHKENRQQKKKAKLADDGWYTTGRTTHPADCIYALPEQDFNLDQYRKCGTCYGDIESDSIVHNCSIDGIVYKWPECKTCNLPINTGMYVFTYPNTPIYPYGGEIKEGDRLYIRPDSQLHTNEKMRCGTCGGNIKWDEKHMLHTQSFKQSAYRWRECMNCHSKNDKLQHEYVYIKRNNQTLHLFELQ